MSLFGDFWSVFCRIQTKDGEILCISPYSARMRENTNQKNSEYRHFLSSAIRDNCIAHVCSHGQNDTYKNHDITVANVSVYNKKVSFISEME